MKLESKSYEDIEIGFSRNTVGRTITEADFVLHAGQTGDFFPHHMDAEWMKTQSAGQRIAHGTLILSIAVGMTAFEINPEALSYGYDRIRFIRPVFIGDTIQVSAQIIEKRLHQKRPLELGFVDEEVKVYNQHQELVMVLTHVYLVNRSK